MGNMDLVFYGAAVDGKYVQHGWSIRCMYLPIMDGIIPTASRMVSDLRNLVSRPSCEDVL